MKNNQKTKEFSSYRTNFFSTKILKVKINFISLPQALKEVENLVKYNKRGQITTPNSEHIVISQSDYRMREIINNSWLAIADGIGLVWAARLLKAKSLDKVFSKKKQLEKKYNRLSGVDLMMALSQLSACKNWRIFLLGGVEGVAKSAALNLKNQNKQWQKDCLDFSKGKKWGSNSKIKLTSRTANLKVQYFSGPLNIENATKDEHKEILKRINKFKPHLLFVALGAPAQEKWIAENLSQLKVNLAMGVGGAFDYLANKVKRAPKWIRTCGLEWLWRLIQEPWRWRRQTRLLKFMFLVLKQRMRG